MKVKFKIKSKISEEKLEVIFNFIKYLYDVIKLSDDVLIELVDKKTSDMTTGVRESHHHIKVLCKDRILVDILRTIAHEWLHEYQHQKMGVRDNDMVKQVGGWIENQANAVSGALVKKFVLSHKDLEKLLY